MTVTIEDAEFEQALKELAEATGESQDLLLKVAVQERLERVTLQKARESVAHTRPAIAELRDLVHRYAVGPVNYTRTEDEILGYGPDGFCHSW